MIETMSDKIQAQLNRIETLLNAILDTLHPPQDDTNPEYEEFTANEIECYVSNSGNKTWKCKSVDGDIVYMRQAHKSMLQELGFWEVFDKMETGEFVDCEMIIGVIPDGDFKKPVSIKKLEIRKIPADTRPDMNDLPF